MRQEKSRLIAGNDKSGNRQGTITTDSIALNLPVTQAPETDVLSYVCHTPICLPLRVVYAPIAVLPNGYKVVGEHLIHFRCADEVMSQRRLQGRAGIA